MDTFLKCRSLFAPLKRPIINFRRGCLRVWFIFFRSARLRIPGCDAFSTKVQLYCVREIPVFFSINHVLFCFRNWRKKQIAIESCTITYHRFVDHTFNFHVFSIIRSHAVRRRVNEPPSFKSLGVTNLPNNKRKFSTSAKKSRRKPSCRLKVLRLRGYYRLMNYLPSMMQKKEKQQNTKKIMLESSTISGGIMPNWWNLPTSSTTTAPNPTAGEPRQFS